MSTYFRTRQDNFTFPSEGNPNEGGHIGGLTISGYLGVYSESKVAEHNYRLQYKALIDGGNTQERIMQIDTATSAVNLKDSLMAYSPNLSSAVLDKVSQRNALLGDTIQYEILKANAEGVTSEILGYLEDVVALPKWMLDNIDAARSDLTYRTYLLDTLMYHNEQKQQAVYNVLRLVQEDTAGFSVAMYRSWLDSADGVWAKREIIGTYLNEGRFDTIETLLAAYDTLVSKADSATYGNYKDFVLSYKNWMETDSSITRLSSTHLAALIEIAEVDEHKYGTNIARNLLNFFHDSSYFTFAYLPEVYYSKRNGDEYSSTIHQQIHPWESVSIKLYPNPAQSTVTVEYNGIFENSKLYITDVLRVLYDVKTLGESNGKFVLNTANYSNGVYLARVETKGRNLLNQKFIVFK